MGISAGITAIVQPIEQNASDLAGIVGDVASQVESYTRQVQVVTHTPITVTLPTANTPASVSFSLPTVLKYSLLAVVALVILRKVLK